MKELKTSLATCGWSYARWLPAVVALAGCDAQAGSDYLGEPLLTLTGRIVAAEGAIEQEVDAALLWHDFATSDGASVTDRVDVVGEFPATFQIDLVEPPPVFYDLAVEIGGPPKRFAVGYLAALPTEVDGGDMSDLREAAAGVAHDRLVVYAEVAISEEEVKGQFPGGLRLGYQIFRIVESQARVEADACLERVSDCYDVCFEPCDTGTDGCSEETLFACFEPCDAEEATCAEPGRRQHLEPGSTGEPLTIVLGGDKGAPDWF